MGRGSVIRPSQKTLPAATLFAASILLAVLACGALLSAQNVVLTGSLSGRVTDQSGAVVPGASVVVQNLGTGVN